EGTGAHGVVEGPARVRTDGRHKLEEGPPGGGLGAARCAAHGGVGVAPRIPEPVAGAELDPAPPRVDVVGAEDAGQFVGPVAPVPPLTEEASGRRVPEEPDEAIG